MADIDMPSVYIAAGEHVRATAWVNGGTSGIEFHASDGKRIGCYYGGPITPELAMRLQDAWNAAWEEPAALRDAQELGGEQAPAMAGLPAQAGVPMAQDDNGAPSCPAEPHGEAA